MLDGASVSLGARFAGCVSVGSMVLIVCGEQAVIVKSNVRLKMNIPRRFISLSI
jgi:hypothetical protein